MSRVILERVCTQTVTTIVRKIVGFIKSCLCESGESSMMARFLVCSFRLQDTTYSSFSFRNTEELLCKGFKIWIQPSVGDFRNRPAAVVVVTVVR